MEIYDSFPFKTQVYQRGMEKLLQRTFLKENDNYIYEWNAIDQLVYLMIQSAYLYVTGHLQIRHLAVGRGMAAGGQQEVALQKRVAGLQYFKHIVHVDSPFYSNQICVFSA